MSQLSLKRLEKSFNDARIIKGIDLEVSEGQFVVFVGPSGCGKSTLLRMIAGLEDVTEGEISISGKVVNDLPPVQRGIAMVFQSYALYPHMTVYENIAFPLRVEKLPQAEVDKRVGAAAKVLQLESRLQHRPGQLSGGQRQRVAIGRAIVRQPKIFLFDEPLSNLDAALRSEMRIELMELHKRLGSTMIYVTHDQIEAMTMADKIVVLNAGEISQVGSPLELYHKPDNLFVAGFIGSPKMNFISGDKAKPFDTHTVGIRGEHITIVPSGGTWTGTVIHTENLGADSYVYLEMGTEEPVVVRLDGPNTYRSGDVVQISPMEDKLHRFNAAGKPVA